MQTGEAGSTGLWRQFRARQLDYSNLKGTEKAILWLSYGVILLNALLIAFHASLGGPLVETTPGVQYPLYVLAVAAVLGLFAFTIFLSGVFTSRARFRVVFLILAMLLYAVFFVLFPVLQDRSWATAALGVALLAVPFGALWIIMGQAHKVRLVTLSLSIATALVLAGVASVVLGFWRDTTQASDILFVTFALPALLAPPMFLVAAADFAEWGNFIAHRLRWVTVSRLPVFVAVVAAVILAGANMWPFIAMAVESRPDVWKFAEVVAEGAVVFLVAGILVLVLRGRDVRERVVRFPPIMAASVVLLGLGYVVSAIDEVDRPPPVYNYHPGDAGKTVNFSVLMPDATWVVDDKSEELFIAVRFWPEAGKLPFVMIVSGLGARDGEPPFPLITQVNELLPSGLELLEPTPLPDMDPPDAAGWQRFDSTIRRIGSDQDMSVVGWKRQVQAAVWQETRDWYIVGLTRPPDLKRDVPKFEKFKRTFIRGARSQAADWTRTVPLGIFGLVLVGGIALAGRRFVSPDWAAILTFLTLGSALAIVRLYDAPISDELFNSPKTDHWMLQLERFLGGLIGLGVVAYLAVRRRPVHVALGEIAAANLALLLLAGVYFAFAAMSELSSSDVIKALVALLTLSWEILVAGETLTNRNTPRYPRRARLLMHLGYVQFVALAIFLFFPFKMREISVKGFDAEAWVATGAVNIGLPLLLTLWVVRIADMLEDQKEQKSLGDPAAA